MDFVINLVIGGLLLLGGLLAIGIAIFSRIMDRSVLRNGIEVDGLVVDLPKGVQSTGAASRSRHMVIEYKDQQGETHQLTTNSSSDMWDDMKGQTIPVFYDRDNPDYAFVEVDAKSTSVGCVIVGLVFCVIGGGIVASALL